MIKVYIPAMNHPPAVFPDGWTYEVIGDYLMVYTREDNELARFAPGRWDWVHDTDPDGDE